MKRLLLLFALLPSLAIAQNVRWDYVATTTTGSGQQLPVLALPFATISFFSCTAGDCSAPANTYNSYNSTSACSTGAQVVLQQTAVCTNQADAQGNFGAWFLPGQYTYVIQPQYGGSYGPFNFTIGAGAGVTTVNPGTGVTCTPLVGGTCTGGITINSGGGPTVQVNGVNLHSPSPVNFVDDSTVGFVNPSVGIIQANANFTGGLQMQPVPPVAGQYVVIPPTVFGGSGSTGSVTAVPPDIIFGAPFCLFGGGASLTQSGFVLPSYINPANVTAVYAFAFSESIANGGTQTCFGNPSNPETFVVAPFAMSGTGISPAGLTPGTLGLNGGWGFQQTTSVLTGLTGANIPSASISATANVSLGFNLGQTFYMPSTGLIVYYTGPAPPPNTSIAVIPPLNVTKNGAGQTRLAIDTTFAFPGSFLTPYTVAQALIAMTTSPANSLLWIYDGANAYDCATGGGTFKVACVFDGQHTLTAWLGAIQAPATVYSVAGTPLPTCNSGIKGGRAVVSDATSPTYLGTYTGSGAVVTSVLCNGTAWVTP